jgi:hypothetical protein
MAAARRDPADPVAALALLPGGARSRKGKDGQKVAGTRLRKVVCSDGCGYPPLRLSRAAIDRGLPICPCGAVFWPWDLDDVWRAGEAGSLTPEQVDAHPLVREYKAQAASVVHGQAGPGMALGARTDHWASPDEKAAWRVAAAVRESNLEAQLAAARALQTVEPIPF